MPSTRQVGDEPIAGYRLLAPLGRGGYGEVWKCEAPGGLTKAIKFVFGAAGPVGESGADQELRALEHVRSIRHPFLLSMDRIERVGRDLVIVMELADESLHDRFVECRSAGLPGVPRTALLRAFQEAAEALDLLNQTHGLQHLDIKPRNLLLLHSHVKVADFGLVRQLAAPGDGNAGAGPISPVYAAPEVFTGGLSSASDQYGLAITYCELLTGTLPFDGKNFRQLALQHTQAEPNLEPLPDHDRAIVARALAKEPAARWESCLVFVAALENAHPLARAVPKLSGARPVLDTNQHEMLDEQSTTIALTGDTPRHHTSGWPDRETPLSAYELQAKQHRNQLAEVWLANCADKPCQVTLLTRPAAADVATWKAGLDWIGQLEFPGLLPTFVPFDSEGRAALASPIRGQTLQQRAIECRKGGLPGIPRDELLRSLRRVAVTLDQLKQQTGVAHLALDPERVQLVDHEPLLADFGLVGCLWQAAGEVLARGNPRYAAPELWANEITASSDSYSLALIYAEMLKGQHPLAGDGSTAPGQPTSQALNLEALSEADRRIVQRACGTVPDARFQTCSALIEALEAATALPPAIDNDVVSEQVIRDVLAQVTGGWQLREHGPFNFLVLPGSCLRHTCIARPPEDVAETIRKALASRWNARILASADDALRCRIQLSGEGWQRIVAGANGLEAHLRLVRRVSLSAGLLEVRIDVRPYGKDQARAGRNLDEVGPTFVEILRNTLRASPERRVDDRFSYYGTVAVGTAAGPTVAAQVKDLSHGGISLYLPTKPESEELVVHLTASPHTPTVPIAIRVVRVQAHGDGFEIGALFLAAQGFSAPSHGDFSLSRESEWELATDSSPGLRSVN